jgi:hypothetical protein
MDCRSGFSYKSISTYGAGMYVESDPFDFFTLTLLKSKL